MKILLIVAICFLPSKLEGKMLDNKIMQIASAHLKTDRCSIVQETEVYSIVQRNDTTGFVIISSSDSGDARIIGYSDESIWDKNNIPNVLQDWLNQLGNCRKLEHKTENNSALLFNLQQKETISPLLTCHWHQNSPYNDLSPVITDGNVKTAAGCVAIAAAQIAYYWRKDNPEYTLKDTPIYPYGSAPVTVSIPKGTPNNWAIIQDSYTISDSQESRYAVAQLCYVIGTTSYLNYASSTGGSINDASNALFGQYNLISTYTTKIKYSQNDWEELIYRELANGRPILCAGNDRDGHAFVLDGYDKETDLYHFNFGWGGSGDGYYPIDDSDVAMGGYNKSQALVYNIHPKNRNIETILSYVKSERDSKINILMEIANKSTLPINELHLYSVGKGNSFEINQNPIWSYQAIIHNDGERHCIIANLEAVPENTATLYLTDENQYLLGEIHVDVGSGIQDTYLDGESQPSTIYDMKGVKTITPTKGLYIMNVGKTKKKIYIK